MTPARGSGRAKRASASAPPDAGVIKAIGHPLRSQILEALNENEGSPAELARRFGEGVNLVAYHVGVLKKAGAIELVRTEPRRGSIEHYYRATVRPAFAEREWAKLSPDDRRAVRDVEVKRIVSDVRAAVAGTGLVNAKAHVSRTLLDLDRKGFEEVAALLSDVVDKLGEIEQRAAKRQSGKGRKPAAVATEVALLHFERAERPAGRGRRIN